MNQRLEVFEVKRYRGCKLMGGNKLSSWVNVPSEEEVLELLKLSKERD